MNYLEGSIHYAMAKKIAKDQGKICSKITLFETRKAGQKMSKIDFIIQLLLRIAVK